MAKPVIVFASILSIVIGAILFVVNLPWVTSGALTWINIVGTAIGATLLAAGITGVLLLRDRR
jgi:hypothetical protein